MTSTRVCCCCRASSRCALSVRDFRLRCKSSPDGVRFTARCALLKAARRRQTLSYDLRVTMVVVRLVKLLPIGWESSGSRDLPPAQYSVRVRQSGYRDAQQNVDMTTTVEWSRAASTFARGCRRRKISVREVSMRTFRAAAQKEFDKGVAALAEGGKDKTTFAVKCFEKAVSIYPKFVEARLKLGTGYMDLEQWDKAEKALLATIEVDPKAFNALFALSEIYLRQNKIAEAEKVLMQRTRDSGSVVLRSFESRARLLGESASDERSRAGKTVAREVVRGSETRADS